MNTQSWACDNCNCVVYTHTDGKHYYDVAKNPNKIKFTVKDPKEIHCKFHTKKGQAWFDELRKTNNDLNYTYFAKGVTVDLDKPEHQEIIKKMGIAKQKLKKASGFA